MSRIATVIITYTVDVEVPDDGIDDYGDLYIDAEEGAIYEALFIINNGVALRDEQVLLNE